MEGADPSLEFVITSEDITNTGAPATLLIFNNEKGFSSKNIDSICSVGRSTKKGNRKRGYIGEKGTLPSFLELYTSHSSVSIVMRTSNTKICYIWFTQNAILSRRLLIIVIGLTWKEVRTSITLLTYLSQTSKFLDPQKEQLSHIYSKVINAKLRVLEVSKAHLKLICNLLELGMKYCCLGGRVQSIKSINKSSCMMKFCKVKIHLIENINKQVKV